MPEMGGSEATRLIRKQISRESQPRIIALTANAFESDAIEYLESGMDEVITKPIKKDQLREALLRSQSPLSHKVKLDSPCHKNVL